MLNKYYSNVLTIANYNNSMEIFCDKELLIFIFPIKKLSENNTDMQDKTNYKSKPLMCLEKSF